MATKKKSTSNLSSRAGDFAKNIWLAGLGAYGESFDEQKSPPKSVKDLPKLFRDLVEKGEDIESTQKPKKSKRLTQDSGESFEHRIKKMRESFGMGWSANNSNEDLSRIESKIDQLRDEVTALARDVARLSPSKPQKKSASSGKKRNPVKSAAKKTTTKK